MPLCAFITILAALPSMVQQILRPSVPGLLLGMANSAFAFFMFSYQVGNNTVAAALQCDAASVLVLHVFPSAPSLT